VHLAAVCAVSILSGALIAAAQDWKAATTSEPLFARVAGWAVADMCLFAGAVCLLGLAGFALWSAVAALNRRSDQRRAALDEAARTERAVGHDRLRDIALRAARVEDAPTPAPRGLQIVRDTAPCPQIGQRASGR
jgi:hypothetical protein